jgi:2-aminoadipate transaminase
MADAAVGSIQELFSERARRSGPARLGDPRDSAKRISFYAGFPDPGSLPASDITEATRIALERDGPWALQYGSGRGYPGLIEELLKKLARDQGIEAQPENVLITNGASQAVALIIDMLVDPGDVVLSEIPTWSGAVHMLRAAGAEVRGIPIDADGAVVTAIERELTALRAAGRHAKLLYTIPTFQNPTGVTTTLERRRRIVDLAREHMLPVIEDDAYFDLRYAGEKLPTLYSLDTAGLVMFLGTFSKIMAAGMRLGWVVADSVVIGQLTGLKHEGGTSPFAGHIAAEFCGSGTLTEHIKELRALYHVRRDTMLRALEREMPAGMTWTVPQGGFFVWLYLPSSVNSGELLAAARERNVEFLPGTACYYDGSGEHELRLSFSFADEAQIERGVAVLGELIRERGASS